MRVQAACRSLDPGSLKVDQAGIGRGDYILSVDGDKIESLQQLQETLKRKESTEKTNVTIWGNGEDVLSFRLWIVFGLQRPVYQHFIAVGLAKGESAVLEDADHPRVVGRGFGPHALNAPLLGDFQAEIGEQ